MNGINGDYKDRSDRIELWGVEKAFDNYISVELLIVDANTTNRDVTVYHNLTQKPLRIRLPKDVVCQDLPASYNQATVAIYDQAFISPPKLRAL